MTNGTKNLSVVYKVIYRLVNITSPMNQVVKDINLYIEKSSHQQKIEPIIVRSKEIKLP